MGLQFHNRGNSPRPTPKDFHASISIENPVSPNDRFTPLGDVGLRAHYRLMLLLAQFGMVVALCSAIMWQVYAAALYVPI